MIRLVLALWLVLCGVAQAQGPILPGPGLPVAAAGTYTGPGDVFSTSVLGAYSCAEAYNAAYATALGNACDLVDSAAPTTVICTLKFLATGKVDLASASCTGAVTPATKCAAATGAVCNISKAYDQSGNGRDLVQVTAANQPTITFSSTPTGTLPAINCGTTASNISISSAGNLTQAQPFTMAAVLFRLSSSTAGFAFGSASGGNVPGLGAFAATNTFSVNAGADLTDNTHSADATWHSLSGLFNGTAPNSAINVDGNDTTGNAGVTGFSATPLRLCRGNGAQWGGLIAEAIMWAATTNATNRNAISTNQHAAGRYNF